MKYMTWSWDELMRAPADVVDAILRMMVDEADATKAAAGVIEVE